MSAEEAPAFCMTVSTNGHGLHLDGRNALRWAAIVCRVRDAMGLGLHGVGDDAEATIVFKAAQEAIEADAASRGVTTCGEPIEVPSE